MSVEYIADPISLSPTRRAAMRVEDDPVEMAPQLEQPSLQLEDVEGRIHLYEGPLSRKVKKAKLKNCRKKRWFSINPGT